MRRICLTRICLGLAAAVALGGASACDDTGLPQATLPNEVDTTLLFAVHGTPVTSPSYYDLTGRRTSRPDLFQPFDFAVDIASDGTLQILPAGALGMGTGAGVLVVSAAFDAVVSAPVEAEYVRDAAVTADVGTVFIVRSRPVTAATPGCAFLGALPRYGKARVLALDRELRSVTLELLVNRNCGYRGLAPGLPTS